LKKVPQERNKNDDFSSYYSLKCVLKSKPRNRT